MFWSILLIFITARVIYICVDYYLQIWTQQSKNEQQESYNFIVYCSLIGGVFVFFVIQTVLFVRFGLKGSSNSHSKAIRAVMQSPVSFFSANPHGRVMNKFSSDQGLVDEYLAYVLFDFCCGSLQMVGAIIISCIAFPFLVLILPFMVYLFRRYQVYFTTTSRELKRYMAITKSPIFSLFAQCLTGLSVIRAFGQEEFLNQQMKNNLTINGQCLYSWVLSSRFFGFRLDCLAAGIIVIVTFGGLIALQDNDVYQINPGQYAIALIYSMKFIRNATVH
eukprot:UN24930